MAARWQGKGSRQACSKAAACAGNERRPGRQLRSHSSPPCLQRGCELRMWQRLLPCLIIEVQSAVQLLDQRVQRLEGGGMERGGSAVRVLYIPTWRPSSTPSQCSAVLHATHTGGTRCSPSRRTCCAASTCCTAAAHRCGSGGWGGGIACIVTSTFGGMRLLRDQGEERL